MTIVQALEVVKVMRHVMSVMLHRENNSAIRGKVENLIEASRHLDAGIITLEEFNLIKSNVIVSVYTHDDER